MFDFENAPEVGRVFDFDFGFGFDFGFDYIHINSYIQIHTLYSAFCLFFCSESDLLCRLNMLMLMPYM